MWVKVPSLPHTEEWAVNAIVDALEKLHGDLGPVLTWEGDTMVVVLAAEKPDFAAAATTAIEAVRDALRDTGYDATHAPIGVEVEVVYETPASERVPARA